MLKIPRDRCNLAKCVEFSRYVGKSKISKLSSKQGHLYPLIRLPTECAESIGKAASIYETSHESKQAFLVVLSDDGKTLDKVIKPVIKLESYRDLNERLFSLESKIAELISLILKSASYIDAKSKKKRPSRDLNPSRSLDRAP